MMKVKKLIISLLTMIAILALVGCGGSKKDERSLSDFIQAYQNEGVEVDPEKKQQFETVNASDGVIFYMDNKPVKIYEYKSLKDLEKAQKDFADMMEDWPTNGKFLLETKSEEAVAIFTTVE